MKLRVVYSWAPSFCYDVVNVCQMFVQDIFVVGCRYHVFLQLKRDILDGRLVPPLKSAALLASYAVQCE